VPSVEVQATKRLLRKQGRKVGPTPNVNALRPAEKRLEKKLLVLNASLVQQTSINLFPALVRLAPQYVADSFDTDIDAVLSGMRERYATGELAHLAKEIAAEAVEGVDDVVIAQLNSVITESIGVSMKNVLAQPGLNAPQLKAAQVRKMVQLTKSIPTEYMDRLETMVWDNLVKGTSPGGIIGQITSDPGMMKGLEASIKAEAKIAAASLDGVTLEARIANRVKFIARDQVAKANAALVQQRQTLLGVDQYIWSTSKDERVRDSHKSKEGKKYSWDSPPADTGHPGEDYQCRCVAIPILPEGA
jgi:SPP1 gp7 family putative phage head morphogenesis protein